MNAADQILLALDAHECWAQGRGVSGGVKKKKVARASPAAPPVEPPVIAAGWDDFGTIGGAHTVHELSELLDAMQSQINSMAANVQTSWASWNANDSATASAWMRDWNTFQARFAPAASAAQASVQKAQSTGLAGSMTAMLGNALTSAGAFVNTATGQNMSNAAWDNITDEPTYQKLTSAFKPSDQDETSLVALDRRWRVAAAGGFAPPAPSYSVPQPTAPDADLGAYKTADKGVQAVHAIQKAAGSGLDALLPGTTGFLAWVIKHRTAIVVTSAVTVGGVLLLQFMPFLMMPVKAAKGLAAIAA